MLLKLILVFTIIPVIELAILIEIGSRLGLLMTLAIVIITGITGAVFAKYQGLIVVYRIKRSLNIGHLPADDIISAMLVLAGGLLLLTPGLLTDIAGFSLVIPVSRRIYVRKIKEIFKQTIEKNHSTFTSYNDNSMNNDDDIIDI